MTKSSAKDLARQTAQVGLQQEPRRLFSSTSDLHDCDARNKSLFLFACNLPR